MLLNHTHLICTDSDKELAFFRAAAANIPLGQDSDGEVYHLPLCN